MSDKSCTGDNCRCLVERPRRLYGASLQERLDHLTCKRGECWIWRGHISNGYGRMTVDGKIVHAHRLAYELAVGVIPDGLVVDHMCRTRSCVNPEHLQAVSRAENNENRSNNGYGATGVRGVSYVTRKGKYEAYATHLNKKHHAGYHDTVKAAARAAQNMRLLLHVNNLADRV